MWNFRNISFALCIVISLHCAQADLSEQLSANICTDDFNRTDSNSLGGNWSFLGLNNQTMAAAVVSQQASITSPAGGFTYASCKNFVQPKSMTVSVRVTPQVSISTQKVLAIVARSQSTGTLSDAYICGFEHTGGAARVALYKGVNTLKVDMASINLPSNPSAGTEYSIAFTLNSESLKCAMTAPVTYEVSATDSTYASGYVGMFAWSLGGTNISYTFDDFKTEVKP
jgi:hypothetical protein